MCSKREIQCPNYPWLQNETMRWSLAMNIVVIIRLSCWRSVSIKYRIFSILACEDKMLRPLTCSTSSTFRERKSWYHVSLGWPVLETSFFQKFSYNYENVLVSCLFLNRFVSWINFLKIWRQITKLQAESWTPAKPYFNSIITIFVFLYCFSTISQMRFRTFQNAYFNAHANIWNKHTLFNKRRRRNAFLCVPQFTSDCYNE